MRTLLIIDPQNDFVNPRGSLYVNGSEKAVENIIAYLKEHGEEIDNIVVTKDSHHRLNVGSKEFWETAPEAFQKITIDDLANKKYVPKFFNDEKHINLIMDHLAKTEQDITIWPTHCIADTWGCEVVENLRVALSEWEIQRQKIYHSFIKGSHPFYEAYSILDSENFYNFDKYLFADELLICGFCTDVCVRYSTLDLISYFRDDVRDIDYRGSGHGKVPEITFLPDCSCAIGNSEEANNFLLEKVEKYNKAISKFHEE